MAQYLVRSIDHYLSKEICPKLLRCDCGDYKELYKIIYSIIINFALQPKELGYQPNSK